MFGVSDILFHVLLQAKGDYNAKLGITILGIVPEHSDKFKVVALAAGSNVTLLADQVARHPEVKQAVTGIVGCAELRPTLAAIEAGKGLALANKETLIAGGPVMLPLAKKHNVKILPADSEQSAVFQVQCIQGLTEGSLRRLILTASGGSFRDWPVEKLKEVTVAEALNHPNWSLGKKVTVDSATMFNKVHFSFHSICFSDFHDSSVIGQLGWPDMRIPLLYTLSWPDRIYCSEVTWPRLDLAKLGKMTFRLPDKQKYPSIDLGYAAGRAGGTMTGVISAANEKAVEMFIEEKISYLDIFKVVEKTCDKHQNELVKSPTLDDILHYDLWARDYAALRSTDSLHGFTYPCPTRVGHRHSRTLSGHSQMYVELIDNMKKLSYVIESCRMHIL
ncbi:hypothetical protein Cgig2_004155 [Carnegiea gigantea]|uniref:1-deoxy-D-xylulose-5-phosphate reductoisomerase n=1 Tax=Carnegiea gigantea TaxID=171969 RepID=A0A9Q1QQY7_9CARY|nr:hypothetical protein Cgig2_004155 [Carnegiea gigantea]